MRILVLSGGGVKGAFQVGVLKQLYEDETLKYDAIFGVSTGALTGGVLAQGDMPHLQRMFLRQVENIYLGIKGNSDIIKGGNTTISKLWNLLTKGGMFDPSPLKKLIDENINLSTIQASKTEFFAGIVNLDTGEYSDYSKHNIRIKERILSSASQPIFFQLPNSYADGGVRNITPIGSAIEWAKKNVSDQEPISIDVILTTPILAAPYAPINTRNPIQLLSRTFDIIMNELYLNDLTKVEEVNEAITNGTETDKDKVFISLNVISPEIRFGDGLTFDPSKIRDMIRHGEEINIYDY